MRVAEVIFAFILIALMLMPISEGKKTCIKHPTAKCSRNTYPKWQGCPNTYKCDKPTGDCCMHKNLPTECNPEYNAKTGAPYACQGKDSKVCDEGYTCINEPANLYSLCCENFICYDNSGNKRRKYEGNWTESDGCTVCTCEANNRPKCDSSICETVCGGFSQFSPCPDSKSCGKQVQIRKCSNSDKDTVSQRNAELNMVVCRPQPPAQCPQPGIALTDKEPITIGGHKVDPEFNYRWMVHIVYDGGPLCGGSILSPSHILTAAHCFYDYGTYYPEWYLMPNAQIKGHVSAKMGKHQLSLSEPLEQLRTVKSVTIHENYDTISTDNDIAIVTLDSPLQFNNHIHPINLPNGVFDSKTIKKLSKALCKVIGWGDTNGTWDANGTVRYYEESGILLEVQLNFQKECFLESELEQGVTNNMFCASAKNPNGKHGQKRLDSCNGDSGGPFMCREGKKWFQYGIVSWGPDTCGYQSGVYTKVSNYVDWIKDVISTPGGWGEFSGYSPCSTACGGGTKSRVRVCTNPEPIGNGECPDYSFKTTGGDFVQVEDEECNTEPCG